MIDKYNTLFILGAGASKPYGFPTAEELKNAICTEYRRSLDENNIQYYVEQVEEFTSLFFNSGETSIDSFLARYEGIDGYKHIIDHGKMSIFLSILNYERTSILNRKIFGIDNDWYSWLYRQMRPEKNIDEFQENKVAIITFNYDRSLEYAFFTYLLNSFAFARKESIIEQLRSIPIIHTYGKLGDFYPDSSSYFSFGGDLQKSEIFKLAKNIKTIYERATLDNNEIEQILLKADRIFILGFGFAPENVGYLGLAENIKGLTKEIYVSIYNNSRFKMERILASAGIPTESMHLLQGSILQTLEERL